MTRSLNQRYLLWVLGSLGVVVLTPRGPPTFFVETQDKFSDPISSPLVDQYEEIDMVKKGGNYGWRVYEGPLLFQPLESPGGNTSASSIHPIFPILGYTHSEIDNITGSASIVGGYFYRSMTDPCMYGRYLYTDLYAGSVLTGAESPEGSGNLTRAKIPCTCAPDSSKQCTFVKGSSIPVLGYVFSFAEGNREDIYYLTSTGVYRVTRPRRCGYLCPKENAVVSEHNKPHSSSSFPEDFDPLLLLVFLLLHSVF